ncbi:MAG: outer membrane protein assembly factor BamD [Chitinophagaceae bacterium]|nr:MAG: outer membrane protein assembly factor BamD [Chitinophagaceae bacterium]
MRFIPFLLSLVILAGCSKGITKILKSPDPEYKLRMAEQYFVEKKWNKAQVLYEDVMPYYKTRPEFQDIYYKYAYCAYNQADYLNAENLFKTFMELFPNSAKAEEVDYMRAFSYYKQSPKPELDQSNTIKAMGMMQVFINTHPNSERSKEAAAIIEICRTKLEVKDYKSAKLYFDMGQFRAAGVAYAALLNSYPESNLADEYKFMVIKSYYRFAEMSVDTKKEERYGQVIDQVDEFIDRFPESKFRAEADSYKNLSQTNIKNIRNEQVKTSA